MNKRQKIHDRKLKELEAEFRELLVPSLQICARGRWGLFGGYDQLIETNPTLSRALEWPEADRLRELATAIQAMRAEFGERNDDCEEFLRLCALHGQNDPGEPTLARAFLKRMEQQ